MTDPLRVAQAYFDAWNARDADGIVATFAEGGTYSDSGVQGLSGAAIADYARRLWDGFPDLSFDIVGETLVGDGLVAAQWLMKGTNTGPFQGLPPTGRSVALPGADFITVEGGAIRSVRGYFDGGEVPRQLGLQILVQPQALGPYEFGGSISARSGKRGKPGAFSITVIHPRSEQESERISEVSREIVNEMMEMPGFIGWTGMTIGDRKVTVTAWEDAESARQVTRGGSHAEAMKAFWGPDLSAGGYTSVWVPGRFNATWVRCRECGRMTDYERAEGRCECGQALPDPPPYW